MITDKRQVNSRLQNIINDALGWMLYFPSKITELKIILKKSKVEEVNCQKCIFGHVHGLKAVCVHPQNDKHLPAKYLNRNFYPTPPQWCKLKGEAK